MVNITKSGLDCLSVEKPKNPTVIGIDPGVTGAVAMINNMVVTVYDFKSIEASISLIRSLNKEFHIDYAVLEKVWFWKGEKDVKTAEVLIRSSMMWQTILCANKIKFDLLTPAQWRSGIVPNKASCKKLFIKKAKELFPGDPSIFNRHDRAEAALIAYKAFMRCKK